MTRRSGLREIPRRSPAGHIILSVIVWVCLRISTSHPLVPSVFAGGSVLLFYVRFRGPGLHTPRPDVPLILLFHPFGSERRNFLLLNWISASLWQFGQPVLPLDSASIAARKTRAPRQPAWRRHRTAFLRVLDAQHWRDEIPVLLARASLIVIDTTVFRENLRFELAGIEAMRKTRETISIHEHGVDAERERYKDAKAPLREIIEHSIGYSLESPSDLETLWREIVRRAAEQLEISGDAVPYPEPPPMFTFSPRHVLVALRKRSDDGVSLRAGTRPGTS